MESKFFSGGVNMRQWLEFGSQKVGILLQSDPDYQRLSQKMAAIQDSYEALLARLSPDDRELIRSYHIIAKDLETLRTVTAWYCGRMDK
jgi:hypothetical protein